MLKISGASKAVEVSLGEGVTAPVGQHTVVCADNPRCCGVLGCVSLTEKMVFVCQQFPHLSHKGQAHVLEQLALA
jgi:hypothetical protein